jgi:hypothetical protein
MAAVNAAQRAAPIPAALTPPVAKLLNDYYSYPSGCAASDGESSSAVCRLGDQSGAESLVIMGDSHAEMWMPAILAMANKDRWAVYPIGKSACIPLEWWNIVRATPDCRAWYRWAVRVIQARRPTVALLAGAFSGAASNIPAAASGITSLISSVRGYSKHVVVLADQPSQKDEPVDCLLARDANLARCSVTLAPQQSVLATTIASASLQAGGSYIDTRGWFCFDDQCPVVIGHTIAYRDVGHITATYASELAEVFRSAFRTAVGESGRGS